MSNINVNNCNLALGSDVQIGVGPECTACDPSTNLTWFEWISSWETGAFRENEVKRSRLGRRDNKNIVKVTSSGSEFTLEGSIPMTSIGIFLGGMFGDLVSSGSFDHEFGLTTQRCPITYTIGIVTPNYSKRIVGAVFTSLEITAESGSDPTLTISGEGAFPEEDATLLPVVFAEETFEAKDVCIFKAPDVADIDADLLAHTGATGDEYTTKLCVDSFTLTLENKLKTRYCLGDTDDCRNKKITWGAFDVKLNIEKVQEDTTFFDEWTDLQGSAYKVVFKDVDTAIGAGNPTLSFDLYEAQIVGYSEEFPEDDLITESIELEGFIDDITDLTITSNLLTDQNDTMYRPLGC